MATMAGDDNVGFRTYESAAIGISARPRGKDLFMKDRDDGARRDVHAFRRAALRIERAKGRRGDTSYLRTTANPSLAGLARHAGRAGLDLDRLCEQITRRRSSPWAAVETLVDEILARRGRLLRTLERARRRAHREPAAGLDIATMNEERFADPATALKSSFDALRRAGGRAEVARVLAVHASNLRECGRLDAAMLALWVALPLAEASKVDPSKRISMIAMIYQGASCVLRARGECEPAWNLISEAEALYCRANNRRGRAVSTLDRASLLSSGLDDQPRAISEISAALHLLRADSLRLICWAHLARALAHQRNGDLDKAVQDIGTAILHVPAGAKMLLGRVRWAQACIKLDLGDLEEASAWLEEAFALVQYPAVDRLLLIAQRMLVASRRGDHAAAASIAFEHLPALLAPIEALESKTLLAAHRELFRVSGPVVQTTTLSSLISTINKARASSADRLR